MVHRLKFVTYIHTHIHTHRQTHRHTYTHTHIVTKRLIERGALAKNITKLIMHTHDNANCVDLIPSSFLCGEVTVKWFKSGLPDSRSKDAVMQVPDVLMLCRSLHVLMQALDVLMQLPRCSDTGFLILRFRSWMSKNSGRMSPFDQSEVRLRSQCRYIETYTVQRHKDRELDIGATAALCLYRYEENKLGLSWARLNLSWS